MTHAEADILSNGQLQDNAHGIMCAQPRTKKPLPISRALSAKFAYA